LEGIAPGTCGGSTVAAGERASLGRLPDHQERCLLEVHGPQRTALGSHVRAPAASSSSRPARCSDSRRGSITERSKRWWPPSVTWHASRPSRAQRVTVLGETPSSRATSDRVKYVVAVVSNMSPSSCDRLSTSPLQARRPLRPCGGRG